MGFCNLLMNLQFYSIITTELLICRCFSDVLLKSIVFDCIHKPIFIGDVKISI